jgi:hypothetical protein
MYFDCQLFIDRQYLVLAAGFMASNRLASRSRDRSLVCALQGQQDVCSGEGLHYLATLVEYVR